MKPLKRDSQLDFSIQQRDRVLMELQVYREEQLNTDTPNAVVNNMYSKMATYYDDLKEKLGLNDNDDSEKEWIE